MLEMGVFGGKYMTDCRNEFPPSWFIRAKICSERHDPKLNCFGVNASKPLSYWIAKGWIHPDDPRGWFQWYCRYYMGRRCPEDERQIKRWKAMQRHIAQLRKHCPAGDLHCRCRQRQACFTGHTTAARCNTANKKGAPFRERLLKLSVKRLLFSPVFLQKSACCRKNDTQRKERSAGRRRPDPISNSRSSW